VFSRPPGPASKLLTRPGPPGRRPRPPARQRAAGRSQRAGVGTCGSAPNFDRFTQPIANTVAHTYVLRHQRAERSLVLDRTRGGPRMPAHGECAQPAFGSRAGRRGDRHGMCSAGGSGGGGGDDGGGGGGGPVTLTLATVNTPSDGRHGAAQGEFEADNPTSRSVRTDGGERPARRRHQGRRHPGRSATCDELLQPVGCLWPPHTYLPHPTYSSFYNLYLIISSSLQLLFSSPYLTPFRSPNIPLLTNFFHSL
jgi:hypothetical protein